MLSNEPHLIKDFELKEPLGVCVLNMICFNLQFERQKGKSEVSLSQLNKGNYVAMREVLSEVERKDTPAGKTVEQ